MLKLPNIIQENAVIIAFIGDNGYGRELAAEEYVAGFSSTHGSLAIDKFSADELEPRQLIDALSTIPFLSQRRMVVARDISTNKSLVESFEIIADSVADTTDFVIIEQHIDGRSKYLVKLKKTADVREFTHLEGDALVGWLVDESVNLGGSLGRQLAQKLIDRLGTNQQLLANELTKLILFNPHITNESIENLTSRTPQSSIFAMLDAAFAGKLNQALLLYGEQRAQGMEPQAILGMITWQLHILAIVKSAGPIQAGEVASRAKLSPFVVRKNQSNARHISDQKLIKLFEQAIRTDSLLKTTSTNADDALQSLILSFA